MIQATVVGRLGADPTSKTIANGNTVTNLSVACNHGFGERQTTTWVHVDVWGKTAEWAAGALRKGCEVVVSGELWQEEWETRDGEKRTAMKLTASAVRQVGERKKQDRQLERTPRNDEEAPF